MKKGFIFDHNRCVACNACSAACILENGLSYNPRVVYTTGPSISPVLQLINLSLACNHCGNAICIEGCPAAALYREPSTGAVLLDEKSCIGCKYCAWNCPYDAPKYPGAGNVIGKCNLCYRGAGMELQPACARACPTGALDYGLLGDNSPGNAVGWFPDKKLDPAIALPGKLHAATEVVPDKIFTNPQERKAIPLLSDAKSWSLVLFTFLLTLSVSVLVSGLTGGSFPDQNIFLIITFTGIIASLYHLGIKKRAWLAVRNIRSSPLSVEILLLILYVSLALPAVRLLLPELIVASAVTGLLLLIAIDRVYGYADSRMKLHLHSGQTFLSSLLIISYLSGMVLPFLFMAALKLASSVYSIVRGRSASGAFALRFLRVSLLIITAGSIVLQGKSADYIITFLFLAGEFLDRLLFYADFSPVNIKTHINFYINRYGDEK